MPKLIRLACLMMAFAVVAVPATVSVAQDKKEAKKDSKKEATKPGTVKLGEGKDGKFRFSIYDGDEKFLANSAAYATKEDATKAVEALKAALKDAKIVYTPKKDDKKDK